jgi:hypothetical protein
VEKAPIKIPATAYQCPDLPLVPNPETVSDKEFADFAVDAYTGLSSCRVANTAMRNYINSRAYTPTKSAIGVAIPRKPG